MIRRLFEAYLRRAGWREGRDRLWRNDAYGGSWKLRNAVREQRRRPVGGAR